MNTCVVCLETDNLLVYDHCGLYYVHEECLDLWKKDECIICREKIVIEEKTESKCKLCLNLGLIFTSIGGVLFIIVVMI